MTQTIVRCGEPGCGVSVTFDHADADRIHEALVEGSGWGYVSIGGNKITRYLCPTHSGRTVPRAAAMTLLDRMAAIIAPSSFDPSVPMNDTVRGYAILAARQKVKDMLVVLRDPGDGVTAAPSYANGEWSRRNVEAYIDAILAEAER